ncbi:TPA: hypothetical protein ACKUJD_002065, partial [Neisseria gonorrhoeae]
RLSIKGFARPLPSRQTDLFCRLIRSSRFLQVVVCFDGCILPAVIYYCNTASNIIYGNLYLSLIIKRIYF